MYSRPKPCETDEDLLKLQEEFFRNKNKVAKDKETTNSTVESESSVDINCEASVSEQLANTFETIPNMPLGSVIEKQRSEDSVKGILSSAPMTGFPKPEKQGAVSKFARKRKIYQEPDSSPVSFPMMHPKSPQTKVSISSEHLEDKNPHSIDKEEISRENERILANMTPEDIKKEQEKYMKSLDPALIAFIKSRKKTSTTTPVELNKSPVVTQEQVPVTQIEIPMTILNEASDNKWLGFDKIEADKLSWMKDVDIRKDIKKKQFEARFDFQGWLLPYKLDDVDEKNRILYHHGEEPDRPGYTLQELFQLSRSTVIQQRIIALNSIANILYLSTLGIYKDIIDIPIEQIFFVLRFCLDDNTPVVLSASIKAMHNLIVFYTDEVGLDILLVNGLGKIQPMISVDDENTDDYTENDQQVVEKNLIKCLVRTNLLNRIRYIINTVQPSQEDIRNCLEILIRLARDSKFVTYKIYSCEGLIKSIINKFIPLEINNGNVMIEAIKFVRILSCREKQAAITLLTKYPILKSIEIYLSNESFYSDIKGLKIQIECFNIWCVFLHYKIAIDDFKRLQPILMRLLDYYVNTTDIDQQRAFVVHNHLASLLVLISELFIADSITALSFMPLVVQCFKKWTYQFINRENTVLNVLSGLFWCIANYRISINNDDMNLVNTFDKLILEILNSQKYNQIIKDATKYSMLLNDCEVNPSSKNLKTLETAFWESPEHVIPMMRFNNCIPFLIALSQLILSSKNNKIKLNFIENENFKSYLKSLQCAEKFCLINNWFTSFESSLIVNILKLSFEVLFDCTNMYKLAVKSLPIFTIRHKKDINYILKNIILEPDVLAHVDILERDNDYQDVINSISDIYSMYSEVLNLNHDILDFKSCLTCDTKIGNIIPMDWLYSPIVALYTKNQNPDVKISQKNQLFIIKNCLKWILFSEVHLPYIFGTITVTEKVCRIACIFLADDSLFLDPEIHDLLGKLLENLLKYSSQLDFDQQIQGIANFEDFYKLLLEQYQGVSYGDKLFANVILLPLGQKQNIKWRKILWSEYSGVIQTMFLTTEQVMFDTSVLFEPLEEDESLILCYKRALASGMLRKGSLLYKVAYHHALGFTKRNKDRMCEDVNKT